MTGWFWAVLVAYLWTAPTRMSYLCGALIVLCAIAFNRNQPCEP